MKEKLVQAASFCASRFRRVARAFERRRFRLTVGLCCLIFAAPLGFVASRVRHAGRVLPGVWVHTVSLSGMDHAEAKQALSGIEGRLLGTPITAVLDANVFSAKASDIELRVDYEGTLSAALGAGREGGYLDQFVAWLRGWARPTEVALRFAFDDLALEGLLESWELRSLNLPSEGGLRQELGRIVAEPPRPGQRIDRAATAAELRTLWGVRLRPLSLRTLRVVPLLTPSAAQSAAERARAAVSGPIKLTAPDGVAEFVVAPAELRLLLRTRPNAAAARLELYFDPIELEGKLGSLRAKLERPPVDASFEVDGPKRVRVVPGRSGTRLVARDVALAMMHAAVAPARIGPLPVQHDAEPSLTTEEARALGIVKLVGSFTTRHACCQPRVKNIHRMADLLDGVVIRPNATFSVNEHVGPRTVERGFVSAPGIEEGEMVDSVGGGVSQVATTLYNAVFWAGYDIVQRQPHSYWFPRYPMGHEATLSWPKPDLVFENDADGGLLIKTHYSKTSVTVMLYGVDSGRKVEASVSRRSEFVEPPVDLVPDQSVPPDEEKVREGGSKGWSVIATRVVRYPDGQKKEEKRKVIYKPRARRLAVHPCRIPEGEQGYTGDRCPEPKDALIEEMGEEAPVLPPPVVVPVEEP